MTIRVLCECKVDGRLEILRNDTDYREFVSVEEAQRAVEYYTTGNTMWKYTVVVEQEPLVYEWQFVCKILEVGISKDFYLSKEDFFSRNPCAEWAEKIEATRRIRK